MTRPTPPEPDGTPPPYAPGHYQLVAETIPHIVWVAHPDGGLVYLNRHGLDYAGVDLAGLAGSGWHELVHPDDLTRVRDAWGRAVGTGRPHTVEYRLRRHDGEYRWHLVQGLPLKDGGGRVVRWLGTCTDIEDRKRAEEALARDALVLANVRDAVVVTDLDGVVTYWNDGATRLFGWSAGEVLGKPITDRYPEAERTRVAELTRAIVEGGEYVGEFEDWRKDGTRVWIDARVRRLTGPDGLPVGVLGVSHDVTERKRAEVELRAWQARFEAVVRATGQVLYDWDPATGEVGWGGSCELVLGCPPGELPQTLDACLGLIHPEDRPAFEAELARVAASGAPFRQEYRFRRRDGSYVVVEDRGQFVITADGVASRMVGFLVDVTERRRLEEQFRQAQKMEAVGRLAGGVAHDFNNLLTVITGYSDLALAALPAGRPPRPYVEAVRDAGERGAGLARQLLAFARKQVLQPRTVDLAGVVAGLEAMLRRVIGEDVTLATASDPDLRPVRADPNQVEQVLMNLAVNARDAMPRGGRLTIEARNAGPGLHVLLSVSDTGGGMPEEVRARAFEPFFTTKPVGQGTGLGLSTVYGIVHAHGGHVELDSRVGEGTTVRVYLPAADGPVTRAPDAAGPRPDLPQGSETVLVVEDDPAVRALTCHVLQACGYTVLEADGAGPASLAAERHDGPLHLLVTDVVMPGVSGPGVAEVLRALRPGLRVLFVSGYTDDEVVRRGVTQATAHFLHKPFTPADLARKVREVLDAPAPG